MNVFVRRVSWDTNPFSFIGEPTIGIKKDEQGNYLLYIDKMHLHDTETEELKERYRFSDIVGFDTIGVRLRGINSLIKTVKEISKRYGIRRVVCVAIRSNEYFYLKGMLGDDAETEEENLLL